MTTSEAAWRHFAMLCDRLAATRSKLAKRAAIAEYLGGLDTASAGLAAQYLTGAVFAEVDGRRLQVGGQTIVRALKQLTHVEGDRFSALYRKYGDLGSAAEDLLEAAQSEPRGVSLGEMAEALDSLAAAGTQAVKSSRLIAILRQLSAVEAKYFIKLVVGDMRIGVKQSLVEEAIAASTGEELEAVRHAEMLLGDLAAVVTLARKHALATARFQMFHPLGFMLATPAASAEEAYEHFADESADAADGPTKAHSGVQIEDKYDGMRAQIQCGDPSQPGRVRIFSRTREDVTASFPELEEWFAVVETPAILDGEILAWDRTADRALPFTALQPRLGRKRVTAAMRAESPVLYLAFDLLLAGDDLIFPASLRDRRVRLEEWAATALQSRDMRRGKIEPVSRQAVLFETDRVTEEDKPWDRFRLAPPLEMISSRQIEEAFVASQMRGNEGLMLKSLESPYQPGRRGSAWIKLKRELATLDVVVTAVEYGHGRRAAVLSDYTFAVRDGAGLRNVGKAYSGLTDSEILNLTQWFLEHAVEPDAPSQRGQFLVDPQIVLEVAFNNVMQSERHDSGYALRFPRIVRLRPDKPANEIDTVERVRQIFESQGK